MFSDISLLYFFTSVKDVSSPTADGSKYRYAEALSALPASLLRPPLQLSYLWAKPLPEIYLRSSFSCLFPVLSCKLFSCIFDRSLVFCFAFLLCLFYISGIAVRRISVCRINCRKGCCYKKQCADKGQHSPINYSLCLLGFHDCAPLSAQCFTAVIIPSSLFPAPLRRRLRNLYPDYLNRSLYVPYTFQDQTWCS